MSNYNDDYDRENEARLEYEAMQQAEAEAYANAEAQEYERLCNDPHNIIESILAGFIFRLFKNCPSESNQANWIFGIEIDLI